MKTTDEIARETGADVRALVRDRFVPGDLGSLDTLERTVADMVRSAIERDRVFQHERAHNARRAAYDGVA